MGGALSADTESSGYIVALSGVDARDVTARYVPPLSAAYSHRLRGTWFDKALNCLYTHASAQLQVQQTAFA